MLNQLSIKTRFMIIISALMSIFILFSVWTSNAMHTLNVNGPIYQRIVQGKDLVADILPPPEYIVESYLVILQLQGANDPTKTTQLTARFKTLQDEFATRHQFWQDQALDGEIKNLLLNQSYAAAQTFYQEANEHYFPALQAKDTERMHDSLNNMAAAFHEHQQAIEKLVPLVAARNQQDESSAAEKIHWNQITLIGVSIFTLLFSGLLTWIISRSIIRQLGGEPLAVADIANHIASGKLDNVIPVAACDTHSVMANMHFMQAKLLALITREAQEKASAIRIQRALDKASSNMMMADADNNIIYINDTLRALFKAIESDFQTELKHFNADQLIGANIDIFHKNPAEQRAILDNLNGTVPTNYLVGNRHLAFIATPVTDEAGQRLGIVVEWHDRTAEVRIENEIKQIVDAIKAGELDSRLNTADKSGFYQTLSVSINHLTGVIEKVFNDVARVMQSMSSGDLTQTITNDYEGIYGSCKNDINTTITKLRDVFLQIKDSSDFISTSSQEIASGNNNLSQRAEEQAASLEQTASSMEELTSTVKNNAGNAQQANTVARNAQQLAEQGGAVVSSAVKAMQEINDSSNKIAAIIGVIDEIAFQTNLLALNASVEAARAGAHGRGFSVVATEVRNLAQRSATAAQESKTLIQNSIQKVRSGTDFVNETGKSLNEIVTGVKQVSAIIADIAGASVEQTYGIEQVNQAVAQMDEITQQNAALAEQAAAASMSMSEQTAHMAKLLAFFETPRVSPTLQPNPPAKLSKAPTTLSPLKSPEKPALATTANSDDEWDEF